MAKVRLRGRGSDGRVAIWTGDDDAPFNNPLSHLGRIKFHSELAYPKVIREWSDDVTFTARTTWNSGASAGNRWQTSQGTRVVTHTLFAHGRAGQPWVLGSIRIGGNNVAFTGSVPVQIGVVSDSSNGAPLPGTSGSPWARWVTLGADSTHVRLFEYCVVGVWTSGPNANASGIYMPQISREVTVWVTDEMLS